MKVLITGSNGQVGRALQKTFPNSIAVDRDKLNITDEAVVKNFDLNGIEAIINAAAITDVDGCEKPENQKIAMEVNVNAVSYLASRANELDIPLIHISSEYVFDGTKKSPYTEGDSTSPLSYYAKTKNQGDEQARKTLKHYIIRTSWVIGDGNNFVKTMLKLGEKGVNPSVVNDQIGRPTFTPAIAECIKFLLESSSNFGTYNLTNSGPTASWADVAEKTFLHGGLKNTVTGITTKEYFADKPNSALRPLNSVLDLNKIEGLGFTTPDWESELIKYVEQEMK